MFILKEKIIEKMKAKNLSIAKLEKEAGLTIHSVRNILKGRIKNPRAEVLLSVAEALECSLLDFMNPSCLPKISEGKSYIITKKETALDYPDLMMACTNAIMSLSEEIKCLCVDDYVEIVKTLYLYSLPSEPKIPDIKFAKWLLESDHILSGNS